MKSGGLRYVPVEFRAPGKLQQRNRGPRIHAPFTLLNAVSAPWLQFRHRGKITIRNLRQVQFRHIFCKGIGSGGLRPLDPVFIGKPLIIGLIHHQTPWISVLPPPQCGGSQPGTQECTCARPGQTSDDFRENRKRPEAGTRATSKEATQQTSGVYGATGPCARS